MLTDSVTRRSDMRSPHARFSFVVLLFAALMLVAGGGVNAQDKIAGIDHWVPSVSAADGKLLNLFVWEKRQKDIDVKEYAKGERVVLLAHGATTPGSLAFDFQLSSKTELTWRDLLISGQRRPEGLFSRPDHGSDREKGHEGPDNEGALCHRRPPSLLSVVTNVSAFLGASPTMISPGAGVVNVRTVLFTPSLVPLLSSEVTV
jgi:hypothetical protein